MIFDVRANHGGDETIARKFASHLVTAPVIYGCTRSRNGPAHSDFAPAVQKTLNPSASSPFVKPTAVLIGQRTMSSAEWFVLMMRAANATLIGDRTRGASGNPVKKALSNGVSYTMSTWVAYTSDMVIFENVGIAPALSVDPAQSFDATHDYVVERALQWFSTGN